VVVTGIEGAFAITPFGSILSTCLEGSPTPADRQPLELLRTAQSLTGTPYLWGGTSAFGIDCSGFVQRVFGLYGLQLPRDAYQQAMCNAGIHIAPDEPRYPGDIVFFKGKDDPRGRGVTHTGIVLDGCHGENDGTFIHAYGKMGVCVSRFQDIEILEEYQCAGYLRIIWKKLPLMPFWKC
jgi:cell wall-associated NlpC family hydrolase